MSCHQAHTGHHEAEEAHKEKMALASYGQTYEFYCETDPLVAGEEAQVLVHLTRLQDFKPQPRASVSLRLSAGGGLRLAGPPRHGGARHQAAEGWPGHPHR